MEQAKPLEQPKWWTREEVWQMEQRALDLADSVFNPHWKRAYEDLAYALNVLDAHMARSSIGTEVPKGPHEPWAR